jgi:hypothetical protein
MAGAPHPGRDDDGNLLGTACGAVLRTRGLCQCVRLK